MKKFLAMLLAVVMVLSMAACSKQPAEDPNKGKDDPNQTETITNPDQINDEMTSEDGKYEIAFITDVGQLKDKSFNQGTYDGVKLYAANNKLSYKYYQPANKDQATDDDRYEAKPTPAAMGRLPPTMALAVMAPTRMSPVCIAPPLPPQQPSALPNISHIMDRNDTPFARS